MVVNGSKSDEKQLLPFFYKLRLNNKKRRQTHKILWICRRFYKYGALSLFGVEHVLGKEYRHIERGMPKPLKIRQKLHTLIWLSRQSTSLVRTRSRVQIPLTAPHKNAQIATICAFFLLFYAFFRIFMQVQKSPKIKWQ